MPASSMTDSFETLFPLCVGRAHEVTGPAAFGFAAIACGMSAKSALWLAQTWQSGRINPSGLAQFCDPQKLVVVRAENQPDVLACAEEALRSGAVGIVVAELSQPIGLTGGRRLQLAARAGNSIGLFIIPEGAGSNAAQTRWHCAPLFDTTDSTLQQWKLIKNKSGTLKSWVIRWNAKTRRVIVVSEARQ